MINSLRFGEILPWPAAAQTAPSNAPSSAMPMATPRQEKLA